MQSNPQRNAAPNPSLYELQAIHAEVEDLKAELTGLRTDLKKLNFVDQIAKGVALGSLFLMVAFFVLSLIVGRLAG